MEPEVIDLGMRHGYTRKSVLHMLVDDSKEEEIIDILEQCLLQQQPEGEGEENPQ